MLRGAKRDTIMCCLLCHASQALGRMVVPPPPRICGEHCGDHGTMVLTLPWTVSRIAGFCLYAARRSPPICKLVVGWENGGVWVWLEGWGESPWTHVALLTST